MVSNTALFSCSDIQDIPMSDFEGKVAIVTGAGNGLGRSHAMAFAARGAKVVVNDLGGSVHGGGQSDAADAVVEEIKAAGGEAVANKASVADRDGAKSIVDDALSAFGTVDIVVNNAGILRDKSFKNMTLDEFDLVIDVHLRGTAYVTKFALAHHVREKLGPRGLDQFHVGHFWQLRPSQLRRGEDGDAGIDECTGHRRGGPQRARQLPRTRRRHAHDRQRAGVDHRHVQSAAADEPGLGDAPPSSTCVAKMRHPRTPSTPPEDASHARRRSPTKVCRSVWRPTTKISPKRSPRLSTWARRTPSTR